MATSGFPALAIQAPPSPIQQLSQVQQVLGQRQQIQATALENQQREQDLADQHALTTAMAGWDGKNYTDLPELITRAGGSGQARMQATNSILAIREKASNIAKSDAITNSNNVETQAKLNDQYRGRVMNIIGIGDDAKRQAAWDAEVTREEQAGTIQPGRFPHQYPGDAQAMNLANNFAVGSQIVKEMQDRQRIALDAWKNAGGVLENVITQERIGGLTSGKVDVINAGLASRWQVLNPGQPLPEQFTLQSDATPADFDRLDKVLEATERAKGTVAQQATTNAIRAQTFEMARDKADMKPVMGLDPKTGSTVLVPMSQAQQMGLQDAVQASDDATNKAFAARHWLTLATKPAPAGAAPEDMSITQLIDKLDKAGQLGAVASRWNEFMTGKVGAGDPVVSALRAKMGLSTTLLMQAHVGNRGSAQMLEHFEDLANQKKLDGPTLRTAFNSEVNYVRDRSMDPSPPNYSTPTPGKTNAATQPGTVMMKAPNGQIKPVAAADVDHYKSMGATVVNP